MTAQPKSIGQLPSHPTTAAIRAALRAMVDRGEASAYKLMRDGQEIHVRDHCVNGTTREGWTLYGYTRDACIGLMLGIESAQ